MKILMLTPVPTHPPIAGNRARILALADALVAGGHTLHLAWVALEDGDRDAMAAHFGAGFSELRYRAPAAVSGLAARARRRVLRSLKQPSAYVWGVDDWYDPALTPQLAALYRRHRFDAVFVEYVFLSRALEAFPDTVIRVIDTHDRFADRHLHYLKAGKRPQWFSTTPADESAGLARADVVLAIQDNEARQFAQALQGRARVTTVGHLLDLAQSVLPADAPRAVFVASANEINVDAANTFITGVLPRVRAAIAGFELLLAGDVCNGALDAAGVRKLGRVDSIANAYAQGALAVNPVRMGTGLNIKTMECLALGMPLVATASGSRGLECLRGQAFLTVADSDAAGMAAQIVRLLRDARLRHALSHQALAAARAWNVAQLTNLSQVLQAPPLPAQCGVRRL